MYDYPCVHVCVSTVCAYYRRDWAPCPQAVLHLSMGCSRLKEACEQFYSMADGNSSGTFSVIVQLEEKKGRAIDYNC